MFFNGKKQAQKLSSSIEEALQHKADTANKEDNGKSPLLERYLQKNLTDHMRSADDEALAKAIQTLLYEDKDRNKHMN